MSGSSDNYTYKFIDDINRMLASLWRIFPSYTSNPNGAKELGRNLSIKYVLQPLVLISEEVCDTFKEFENINVEIKAVGKGSFGQVGPLYILEEGKRRILLVSNVSFSPDGYITLYYSPVYIKKSLKGQEFRLSVVPRAGLLVYTSNDFLHESIVQGLVSHLYDLGVCPHFTKIYGLYVCKDEVMSGSKDYINYSIIDKNTTTLYQVIHTAAILHLTVDDLIGWMVQAAYTFYIAKRYYGMVHYDTHPGNMMISRVKRDDFLTKRDSRFTFGEVLEIYSNGKKLSDVEVITYKVDDIIISVRNNGYIFKLIDYGLTSMDFSKSVENKDLPIAFYNEEETYFRIPFLPDARRKPATHGDIEYNYSVYAILYDLIYVIANPAESIGFVKLDDRVRADYIRRIQSHTISLYNQFLEFAIATIPGITTRSINLRDISGNIFSLTVPGLDKTDNEDPEHPYRFNYTMIAKQVMPVRDVGTTSSISSPLRLIDKYLKSRPRETVRSGSGLRLEGLKPESILLLSPTPYPVNEGGNRLEAYYNAFKRYTSACFKSSPNPSDVDEFKIYIKKAYPSLGEIKDKSTLCALGREVIEKTDPNNTSRKSIFSRGVGPSDLLLWDYNDNNLKYGIVESDIEKYLIFDLSSMGVQSDDRINVYNLTLYPYNYGMPGYEIHPSQRLIKVSDDIQKDALERVELYVIYSSNYQGRSIIVNNGIDLFTGLDNKLKGSQVSIGVGYYVTNELINNPLTPLQSKDNFYPIGYYYNRNTPRSNGTLVPVPLAYRNYWATIYIKDGKISIIHILDFLKRHKTTDVTVNYQLIDKNQNNISVVNDKVSAISIVNGQPSTSLNYDYAFDAGPILIWDSKIVFTPDVIGNERLKFVRDGQEYGYKLDPSSKSNTAYSTTRNDLSDPYGQRKSNLLTSQSVIAEDRSGNIIFFVFEGLGFTTQGVTRTMMANLINRFNVVKAVCLNNGLSSNAVVKTKDLNGNPVRQWLSQSPYIGPVGTSIILSVE